MTSTSIKKTFIAAAMALSLALLALTPVARASTLGVSVPITDLQNGLVAWYSMDGTSLFNNVQDVTGDGYDGYLTLGTKGYTATTTSAGIVGQALKLDGIDDKVTVPNGPSGVKAVSFWAKVATSTSQGFITLNGTVNIKALTNGTVQANGFSGATLYIDDSSTNTKIDKDWHLITVTTATAVNATALAIGQGSAQYCGCKIDGVRLYSRELSANDVMRLYVRGTGKTRGKSLIGQANLEPGLLGWWTFDGPDTSGTTTATDMSGNGNDGTTNAFATMATTSTYQTAGQYTVTLNTPTAYSLSAEAWAGGGGGGSQNLASDGGGGGGGGAYAMINNYPANVGGSYYVFVGAGGAGGPSGGGCGKKGQGSSFGSSAASASSTLLADGGNPGCNSTGTPPPGGLPGAATSSVGDVLFSGGQGEVGRNNSTGQGGYGGSSAGNASNGFSGPQNWGTVTYPTASTPAGAGNGGNGGAANAGGSAPASGRGGGGGGTGEGTTVVGGAGAQGKVVITGYTAPGWTIGKVGQSASFNGMNQYISVANSLSGVQSVSFWFKASTTTTQSVLALNGSATITISSNTVNANNFTSPTRYVDGVAASGVSDTQWHFITVTTATPITASAITIGKAGAAYCGCSIDNVRMYSRVLSAAEVAQLYGLATKSRVSISSDLGGPSTGTDLAAWYTMDGPDMLSRVADKAGGFDGSLIVGSGGYIATTTKPGKLGQSLKLDGVDDYIDVGTGPASVRTVSFWLKPLFSGDQYIIDLDGGLHTITASSSSSINVTGFSSPTIYIDDAVSSTIDSNWHQVTVTTATPVDASALKLGRVNSSYCGCALDDVRFYSSALSTSDIRKLHALAH